MVRHTGARIRVGCSGWHYEDWRGRVYPTELAKSRWLNFYSGVFDTVELNNTFYRLPSETAVTRWAEATGDDFVFAVKGSRYITHVRRLNDVEPAVQQFVERLSTLGSKLGPVLWQLPPGTSRDDTRLEAFLRLLPTSPRNVIEFRHASWRNEDIYSMLRCYGVALCLIDMPGFRSAPIATTDFIYVRFHGADRLYSSSYELAGLERWAGDIRGLSEGVRSVYAYFNNDVNAYAVDNALTLRRLLAAP
jgi:uncharacterized protein YecE (DUF72 family)